MQKTDLPLEKRGKSFVVRSWKMLPALLLLALFLTVGQGITHAATSQTAVIAHVHPSLTCNVKTYPVQPTASLERNTGEVVHLQADNLNHNYAVDIWQDGVFEGEYYVPTYYGSNGYGSEIYIYVYNGGEWVDACTNWTYLGS